jgi:hypothetical protein
LVIPRSTASVYRQRSTNEKGTGERVTEGEKPTEAAAGAPAGSRWFISAPAGMDLGPLLAGPRRRPGTEPYVLSDVAPLGANIQQSVLQAIKTADHVLVVLADAETSPNSLFEAGFAAGLGKSVVILADPEVDCPPTSSVSCSSVPDRTI